MNNPKISILIPFLNAEKYIAKCLQSILDQTETHWEIIAVDDHSDDGSCQIVQDFARVDDRIVVVVNQGRGIIDALCTGYAKSSGALITRMDADDIMADEKLAELKKISIKHGCGVVATGLVKYFSDNKLGKGYRRYENWLNHIHQNDKGYQEIYKECVIPSPCWMVWRRDLDKVNAFNSKIYPEDYDLCFRFYKAGLNIVSSKKILHYWRDYPERTSRNDARLKDQSFIQLKLDRYLELEAQPQDNLVVWGTGDKGKALAKLLNEKRVAFNWVCNDHQKYNGGIYNKKIESFKMIRKGMKVLIAVAQKNAAVEIKSFLNKQKLIEYQDYYFFC